MGCKIDDYGLRKVTGTLRANGKSYKGISRILNENYIPKDEEKISDMAVARWIKANQDYIDMIHAQLLIQEEPQLPEAIKSANKELSAIEENYVALQNQNGVSAAEDVNPYEETLQLIDACDMQIDILKRRLDLTSDNSFSSKAETDASNLLQKYISIKQSLLADIHRYQVQIASYGNMKELIQIVHETLKETCPQSVYDEFRKRLAEKQAIRVMIK